MMRTEKPSRIAGRICKRNGRRKLHCPSISFVPKVLFCESISKHTQVQQGKGCSDRSNPGGQDGLASGLK